MATNIVKVEKTTEAAEAAAATIQTEDVGVQLATISPLEMSRDEQPAADVTAEHNQRNAEKRRKEEEEREALGLRWCKMKAGEGNLPPAKGQELTNEALSKVLLEKQEFTKEEWAAFGVQGLCRDHYILSGGAYFVPAGEESKTAVQKYWCICGPSPGVTDDEDGGMHECLSCICTCGHLRFGVCELVNISIYGEDNKVSTTASEVSTFGLLNGRNGRYNGDTDCTTFGAEFGGEDALLKCFCPNGVCCVPICGVLACPVFWLVCASSKACPSKCLSDVDDGYHWSSALNVC